MVSLRSIHHENSVLLNFFLIDFSQVLIMTGLDFFAKAQVVEKRNNISKTSFESNAQPSEIISTH